MAFTYPVGTPSTITLSVPYSIMWDSGIWESNPAEGPKAVVKFKCLWDDHYTMVQELMGLWVGKPPSSIVYTLPFSYPPSPNLICTNVTSIEPFGRPWVIASNYLNQTIGLPWIARKRAIITAEFTVPPYRALQEGGFWSLSIDTGGEFLTLPDITYRFADGTPTGTPVGFFLPQVEITVTRYKMPFIPDQVMIPLTGSINGYPFQIGYNIYPPYSLMFMPGHTEVESDVLGNLTYTTQYKFMYRPVNWQFEFKPDRTTGFALVTDGNGNPKFKVMDFGILP